MIPQLETCGGIFLLFSFRMTRRHVIIAAFVFFAIVVIAVPTVVFIVALPEQTDNTTPTTTTTTTTTSTGITDTDIPSTSGTPNPATTLTPISTTTVKNREGLFIVGDLLSDHPPELWSPDHSCQLGQLGNQAMNSFTLNTVNKVVINCHSDKCERLDEVGSWTFLTNTLVNRKYHTSAVYKSEILLIGGTSDPTSTEWIPLDGSQAQNGFLINPGRVKHCSIQPSSNVVILTGGTGTGNLVTQFVLPDGASPTALPQLNVAREIHACGAYDQVCADIQHLVFRIQCIPSDPNCNWGI